MADNTGIQWTDATWNPIAGCSLVSPGCTNCYAMKMAARIEAMSGDKPTHYAGTTMPTKAGAVWTGQVNVAPDHILTQPLRWKRPRRIFVNSMSDLFHPAVPDDVIDKVFAVMTLCPQHIFQVLTKRPDRMRRYLGAPSRGPDCVTTRINMVGHALMRQLKFPLPYDYVWDYPLPNVWLGVSVEDQARANERIPDLLDTPAAVRWISGEPLLWAVDWKRWLPTARKAFRPGGQPFMAPHFYMTKCEHCSWVGSSELCGTDQFGDDSDIYCANCHRSICGDELPNLDWVVAGGESGPGARPMHPDWARSLRDQCKAAGVPFFFKQWGSWAPAGPFDEYDTSAGRAGKPPAFFVGHDGNVNCFHSRNIELPTVMLNSGKKAAGDLLDGIQHHNWPEVRP